MKIKFLLTLTITTLIVFASTNDYRSDLKLGRNSDPKIIQDISKTKLWFNKRIWEFLTIPGLRNWTYFLYPKETISYIQTDEKIVAFTIDDGFCGLDNPDGCMVDDVRLLFERYNSKATFFTTGSHCQNASKSEVLDLLNDGHELANHGMYDTPYNNFSKKDFENDLDQTNAILKKYTNNIPSYYRAPHAKYSKIMDTVIKERGLTHVVCDAFATDTSTPDPEWISNYIIKKTKPGSIILIHMPEKGVREWNLKAMELTLMWLKENNYKVVTLTELFNQSI